MNLRDRAHAWTSSASFQQGVNNMQSEHKEPDDRLDRLVEAVRRLEERLDSRSERVLRE